MWCEKASVIARRRKTHHLPSSLSYPSLRDVQHSWGDLLLDLEVGDGPVNSLACRNPADGARAEILIKKGYRVGS